LVGSIAQHSTGRVGPVVCFPGVPVPPPCLVLQGQLPHTTTPSYAAALCTPQSTPTRSAPWLSCG
jgi:hypothetical protein